MADLRDKRPQLAAAAARCPTAGVMLRANEVLALIDDANGHRAEAAAWAAMCGRLHDENEHLRGLVASMIEEGDDDT